MKKLFYLMTIITVFIFVLGLNAWAADKIGFINLQEIMQNSSAGKKAPMISRSLRKRNSRNQNHGKSIEKMKEELEKQGSIMTQSSRSEKEAAYQKKMRDYQLLVNDTNEELKKRDQEMTQKLMPGIIKIVRSIAEREKYTLVIDVATMPIPYYAKESDFSNRVIEEFNKTK